jgi:hypothetical protein
MGFKYVLPQVKILKKLLLVSEIVNLETGRIPYSNVWHAVSPNTLNKINFASNIKINEYCALK